MKVEKDTRKFNTSMYKLTGFDHIRIKHTLNAQTFKRIFQRYKIVEHSAFTELVLHGTAEELESERKKIEKVVVQMQRIMAAMGRVSLIWEEGESVI
ncbi:uncharacterized protein NESG_00762 [Nematocida ausubeli]|uniref:Uncharacterized protein n=1 Tax=Nematocida ausubeli (strain ATCC PRA-371 / ERTm2) TaxID=1913371 RepID=H8Z9R7_NEMA1|nr:uncharacterized protein NESG_00762 [Nematocida ausubeli]EHY66698.1 hypothetical protein NERG_00338 [Nematocida ausubeli]KAI5133474.1 hypothetical protein NEAUS06_0562 [Nematocida ausubeli]KFG26611.1 hypothetical protein NESG_00762 [Nematocida ausubeli]